MIMFSFLTNSQMLIGEIILINNVKSLRILIDIFYHLAIQLNYGMTRQHRQSDCTQKRLTTIIIAYNLRRRQIYLFEVQNRLITTAYLHIHLIFPRRLFRRRKCYKQNWTEHFLIAEVSLSEGTQSERLSSFIRT